MNLKTFTAKSMAEALAQVRRQLGTNAVILHTRTFQRGGILGFGARQMVEVTAADGREYARQRRPASQRGRPRSVPRATAAPTESQKDGPAGDLIRRTYAAARAEFERSPTSEEATPSASVSVAAPRVDTTELATSASASSARHEQLAEEMRSMKRMVARMMGQQQREAPAPDVPDKLFDQYLALLEQEVAEELAGEIVQQVRQGLNTDQLNDEQVCRRAVIDAVAGLLPHGEQVRRQTANAAASAQASEEGRPRTIALVGPTGVGKTTTIAKLAATFKLKQGKQVGLITMDTYRIAAVDQLQTYANIIGVPLHVVSAPAEMAEAVGKCAGCDVVLIDTAGRSQRDDPRLEELRTFLEAAAPHETHLVLSSTCTQRVLEDTIERFSKIRTERIIFTKLDEAVTFGVVLNVLRKVKKRLSYVTTGQEVPHQIEPGRPDRLAALMLGETADGQGAGQSAGQGVTGESVVSS